MKHSIQKLPVVIAALLIAAPLSANIDKLFPEELQNAAGESVTRDSLKGKIVGVYFSAEWCPAVVSHPSGKFQRNKDDFEVVFVSSDCDGTKEIHGGYREMATVKNGSAEARKLKQQFEVRGIPKLVTLDQNGKTLTTDGRGAVSRNPGGAIAAWKKSTQ